MLARYPDSGNVKKLTLFLIFFSAVAGTVFSQSLNVVINEFLASNSSINTDPDFSIHTDWLELFNPDNDTVDLSAWYLTDDLDIPAKWQFPDGVLLAPGEFMIIWADGKDVLLTGIHTNFKFSKSGEELGLSNSTGTLIDSIGMCPPL